MSTRMNNYLNCFNLEIRKQIIKLRIGANSFDD